MRRLGIALLAGGILLAAGAYTRPAAAGAAVVVRTETVHLSLFGLT
jgi:hypothetical protein